MMKEKVSILAMMFLVVTLTACGAVDKKTVENSVKPSNSTQQKETPTLKMGETGATDKFEIAVTSATKATEWINSPEKGYEYVVVSVKVKNISKEANSISVSDFQYVNDKTGSRQAYARTTGTKTAKDTFGAADIAPGETFEGSIVYAIPVEMTQIELHFIEAYKPTPMLRFQFSK